MNNDTVFYTATMAKVHANQGNLRKAAEIYKHLIKQEPDRQDIRDSLAELEKRLQQRRKANIADLSPLIGRWIELAVSYSRLRVLKNIQNRMDS
jgi:hypothetical protein